MKSLFFLSPPLLSMRRLPFLPCKFCDPLPINVKSFAVPPPPHPVALFPDPKSRLKAFPSICLLSRSLPFRLVPMETAVQRVQAHCYADRSGRPTKWLRRSPGSDWQRFSVLSPAFRLRLGSGRSPEGRRWIFAKDSVAAQWIWTQPEWFRHSIIPPVWPLGRSPPSASCTR